MYNFVEARFKEGRNFIPVENTSLNDLRISCISQEIVFINALEHRFQDEVKQINFCKDKDSDPLVQSKEGMFWTVSHDAQTHLILVISIIFDY